jgi:uncharacterized tellurite resistance protein B-like protein
MGILSRLTGAVTPQKKATDDVLLLHSLLLMSSADGAMEDSELDTVQAFFNTLPEFAGKDFNVLLEQCNKLISKYPNLLDSVKALADLSNDKVKLKCWILCADIAMSSGDVDESEDRLLESMQRMFNIDDATAEKILFVLTAKYAS